IHQITKPERLLREPQTDAEGWNAQRRIDEELGRVVAGLSMNVHGGRVVGGVPIVEPVVIRKPAIAPRDSDELTRAGVIQTDCALFGLAENLLDAVESFQESANIGDAIAALDVDVCQLVVRHGERLRGAGVELLAAKLAPDPEQPRLAERTIYVNR